MILGAVSVAVFSIVSSNDAAATPFTTTAPNGIPLPSDYPEAGGVAMIMVGDNGAVYYQFSDPDGAFVGFNSNGRPSAFRGNPFTINNPINLDCGATSCTDYFGGGIAEMYVRFSAYDGDTQTGGFDEDDISLLLNGVSIGNWSDLTTERTNEAGTVSQGFERGFGNNTFNTGWFSTTNATLLDNILATGQTTTQVFDRDPNDNYWDFRRGDSLTNTSIRTVAPGYQITKTASTTTFASVGQVITYTYVVSNVGSVDITDLAVVDDRIASISCSKTTISESASGGPIDSATCTGSYTITQEDYDAQSVTNTAYATGTPAYGTLGQVVVEETVTGPALSPSINVTKSASESTFSAAGEVIEYTYVITNTGDATLADVTLTDDKIPGTLCTIAALPPQAPDNIATCTASYTVTSADVVAATSAGTPLVNTATVTSTDPDGGTITDTDTASVNGPSPAPEMLIDKYALQGNFDSVGDLIQFEIEIVNSGNVDWPSAPSITDPLITGAGGSVSCPAGAVAQGETIVCTADYTITQADLDAGDVTNDVTASITVSGQTATESASTTVPAITSAALGIDKRLPSGAATTFDTVGQTLTYEYVLTNTGTVTLSAPSVADDKVSVTCPVGDIAPGASVTCTSAAYTVTQGDLDDGSVVNVASGSAIDPQSNTITSATDSLAVAAQQAPALDLEKSAPVLAPVDFVPGRVVTYKYSVTNTGNVTITDPITVSDDKISGPIACGTSALAPGATRVCTADYTVTSADVVAGSVSNRATASDGIVTSNEDTVTVPQSGTPAIDLAKTALTADFDELADTINYQFTVTNSGDTTIIAAQTITVDDPKIGTVDCSSQPATLAPGASFNCTGTYSAITQAEIDAGEVRNSATASFTGPNGLVESNEASAVVTSSVVPGMTLSKTGPASFGAVGSLVTFDFALTNSSAQTISSATVTDPMIPGLVCSFTDIAPFDTVNCSGDYVVTQADLDAGTITNMASASGTAPTGESLSATASETVTADPGAIVRALSLDKTADVASFAAVGDVIDYSFAVTNTGTVTLNTVTVSDPTVGLSCVIPVLAPGETNDKLCVASHTVSQSDINAGQFDNTATASAPGASPSVSSVSTTGPVRVADFTVTKTASATSDVTVGQTITYQHVVTNTGNVTLSNLVLSDSHTSASGTSLLPFSPSDTVATLAPGDSVTLTTAYTVTQADIDAGAPITNTVSGTADAPAGVTDPTATDSEFVNVEAADPQISVTKSEQDGSGTYGAVGTTETFTFLVTNTGNVTLTGVSLTDDLTGFGCALPAIAPGASVAACADTTPLSTTYTITQADVDRGQLINTVQVSGPASDSDTVSLNGPSQTAAMTLSKTATGGAGFDAVGDILTYDYVVTNSGNVTLTSPITVNDDKTTVSCPGLPAGGLAPGASLTCTSSYSVTQADIDAGTITNLANAETLQTLVPGGVQTIVSNNAVETVSATQSPGLSVSKIVTPATDASYDTVGDTLSYDFTVTNTGNVTIPAPITVDDSRIGSGLACGAAPLAPGASVTCTHTDTVDQADLDSGAVTNTATPVATFNAAPVPAVSDTVTVPAVQTPELTFAKDFVSITGGIFAAGETATYRYTVTNTGNTTVTTEPTVTDNLITNPADLTIDAPFPAGGLAPGDTITYTGTYVVTLVDVQLGSVTNSATATAGPLVSNPDSETIPVGANPALDLTKSTTTTSFSAVGDVIEYTYTVTNTSEGTPAPSFANAITVSDDKIPGVIACDPTADFQLSLNESTTCTASYTVTQSDLDTGSVTNAAVATTEFSGTDVFSPSDTVTVNAATAPQLSVTKVVASGPSPAAVGDVLTYRIIAENAGNQTLSGVEISDPMLAALSCTVGGVGTTQPTSLSPGQALQCEGDYTVLQSDLDAQQLTNTATAQATNPQGASVSDDAVLSHPLVAPVPAMTVAKTQSGSVPADSYSIVGEELTYDVTVTNSGNVTLSGIEVVDDLVPGVCVIGTLEPGQSDSSCSYVYEVTQADVDAGSVTNTATVSALPVVPGGVVFQQSDTHVSDGPVQEPAFALVKTADVTSFDAPGQTITYSYTVANAGNVTLFAAPSISDDKIASVSCPALSGSGLAPGAAITCTGTYVTTQADLDAGEVTNVASVGSTDAPFNPVSPGAAQATETVPAQIGPAITLDKTASDSTDVTVGQVITYSYTIENTGNVTLSNLVVSDAHTSASGTSALPLSGGGTIASLAPGASATLTATYTVTQDDVDAGADLTNVASLTADSPDATTVTATDSHVVSVAAATPSLEAIKTVTGSTGSAAGDSVTFDIAVENTGNVTVSAVALSDTLRRLDGTDVLPSPTPVLVSGDGVALSPAEVWVYRVSHVLSQDDVDAGGISNSARVSGTTPSGGSVTDLSDSGTGSGSTATAFVIPANPQIETTKTIAVPASAVGQTVVFEITVENTGNVSLSGVSISSDTLTRADGTLLALSAGPDWAGSDAGSPEGDLGVGETASYTAQYVLTQADVDAGGISNTAVATAYPPTGSGITDAVDTPAEQPITAAPALSMDKSLSSGGPSFAAVGDVLEFSFDVTNTGNVTLTDPITISDPLITDSGGTVSCPAPPLAPGASITCTGDYTVVQQDLDAGSVSNSATASTTGVSPVTDSVTVPAIQSPAMSMTKVADPLASADFVVGNVASYTYTVRNTGNVTITDPIVVSDNLIPTVACDPLPSGGLAPGDAVTCTGDYTITATDVALASATNLASASSGGVDSAPVSETIPISGIPALTTAKSILSVTDAADAPRAGGTFVEVGDKITYEYQITNSGEVAFASAVTIVDDKFATPIACYTPSAANPDFTAGETVTCEATYVVTQDDLDAGQVTNNAYSETSYGPGPTPVTSPPVAATANADTAPAIELVKTVDLAQFAAVGDVLTYSFEISNTGNQTLTDVSVTDPLIPGLSCVFASLDPGASETCTGTVTVTQAQMDDGQIDNVASVTAVSPSGGAVSDTSDPVTSLAPADPSILVLDKSVAPDPFGGAGTTATYRFAVTNDGPFTLFDVTVSDPLVPGYNCVIASLAPGVTDMSSCVMPYTVTQDDVDAGAISNTASVVGETRFGRSSSASDTITTAGPAAEPSLSALKTADVPSTTLGSIITYSLRVENTGNVTLTAPDLVDEMQRIGTRRPTFLTTPFTLVSGDDDGDALLDVGEAWIYTATHEITQSDINAGGLSNFVRVSAQDPNGTVVQDLSDDGVASNGDDNPTLVPIVVDPVLDVTKTVATPGAAVGDVVVFRIEAANRGNVDISAVGIVDTLSRRDGTALSPAAVSRVAPNETETVLSPGDLWAWEVSYELIQDDIDFGGIENLATVSGESPDGSPVSDVSADGDDLDGNPTPDPTVLLISPAPGLDTVKSVVNGPFTSAGDVVEFQIAVTNTGNVSLADVSVTDTLSDLSGNALVPDSVSPSGPVDLAPSGTALWSVLYTLTQDDIDSGGVQNTAVASGTTPLGGVLSDTSDDGDDTDGNTLDDPTVVSIDPDPSLEATKVASTPVRISGTVIATTFTIEIDNIGNVTHRDLSVVDDMTVFVAPAVLVDVGAPVTSGLTSGSANTGYDGVTDTELLSSGATLAPGDVAVIEVTVQYDVTNGSPEGENTVVISSDRTTSTVEAKTRVAPAEAEPDLLASKTVTSAGPYRAGSVVSYLLEFTNGNTTDEANVSLVDVLPVGMLYVADSAELDGVSVEPLRAARRLTWSGVDIPAGATVSIEFSALLIDGAGRYTNTTFVTDASGRRLSNIAEASIDVAPEAVFDCSDVIGKVFEDLNGNGHQDAPSKPAQVSNQDYVGEKLAPFVEQASPPEKGIPGVRIATVRGDIITTDQHGRFHVPCAALPSEIGSNFTLKLDERSLPTGYAVTTENPRSLRLTAGIMAEMNFGVRLGGVVNIDLLDASFVGDALSGPLATALSGLQKAVPEDTVLVRMTYYTDGEPMDLARARVRAATKAIRTHWRGLDRPRIEVTISEVR